MSLLSHCKTWLPASLLLVSVWASSPLPAVSEDTPPSTPPSAWETMSNPDTGSGLVNCPRLLNIKGRVMIFWAGTNLVLKQPEVFFASRSNGDDKWSQNRAPFHGADSSRVRHLAVATARDIMAVLYQRESAQGGGAMEVYMSLSADWGYSFGKPFLLDSYVLGDPAGSYVTVAARQGTNRSEFAAAWVAEGGAVRASAIDTRGGGARPEPATVGHVVSNKAQAEMVGAGSDGFFLVWPEALSGLKSAHIKPLLGGVEPTMSLAPGDFQRNVSVCYNYRGPGMVVATAENGDQHCLLTQGAKFQPAHPTRKDDLSGRGLRSRTAMDDKQRVHRATLDPSNRLIYTSYRDGKWSAPETIAELRSDIPVTGFDIAASEDYLWVAAGQEQMLTIKRRKVQS